MFQQNDQLLRQVDAVLAGREYLVSIGSVRAASEELQAVPAEAVDLLSPFGPNIHEHCEWELRNLEYALGAAMHVVQGLPEEPREDLRQRRDDLEGSVGDCERWVMRTQAEGTTAVGPTGLPLLNLVASAHERADELSLRCHLYAALEQCEVTLDGTLTSDAERQGWEGLAASIHQVLANKSVATFDPLLNAAQRVELALAETAEWTTWTSLNKLLSSALGTVLGANGASPYQEESHRVHRELDSVQRQVLSATLRLPPSSRQREVASRLETSFRSLQELIRTLDEAVSTRCHAVIAASGRRLRWTLTDLALCQTELETLEAPLSLPCMWCNEKTVPGKALCEKCSKVVPGTAVAQPAASQAMSAWPMDNTSPVPIKRERIVTENMRRVACTVESYVDGTASVEELDAALRWLETALENAVQAANRNPVGLDLDLFEQGLQSLYQAVVVWSDLRHQRSKDSLEAGMDFMADGIQYMLESQSTTRQTELAEVSEFGLVA